jgi:hypothetical protein
MGAIFTGAKALHAAMLSDLSRSGLDKDDADKLQCKSILGSKLNGMLPGTTLSGYVIPYFDIDGKKSNFFRYRFLDQPLDFKALAGKSRRYTQPRGSSPQIYFPPLAPWHDIATVLTIDILVTEGEKKAASACKFGFPTLGLGGVWNFRSAKEKQTLIPQFSEITWVDRKVIIAYDSDTIRKPSVMQAENALAAELIKLGAKVFILRLPEKDGGKVGLDDYLVAHGADGLNSLMGTSALIEWERSAKLHALSGEVVYIMDPATILRLDNLQRMSRNTFLDAYAPRDYTEIVQTVTPTGAIKNVAVLRHPAKEWIAWQHRPTLERISYCPGEDSIHRALDGKFELNSWSGWAVEPKAGNVKPWLDLLAFITSREPQFMNWCMQWFACPIQQPGIKMFTAFVVWSQGQGIGKSLLGETMEGIYGKNYGVIDNDDLDSRFNSWAVRKQFLVGNEMTGKDSKQLAAKINDMITRKDMKIENKGMDPYYIKDCINYYVNSNSARPIYAQDGARRFMVLQAPPTAREDAFYAQYANWLYVDEVAKVFRPESMAALMHHLLNVELHGFNPTAKAPTTIAMNEMIENSRSPLEMVVNNLRDDPGSELDGYTNKDRCLFTLSELGDMLREKHPEMRFLTNPSLSAALSEAGFTKLHNGEPIRCGERVMKLYAIRDRKKWESAPLVEVGRRYVREKEMVVNFDYKGGMR